MTLWGHACCKEVLRLLHEALAILKQVFAVTDFDLKQRIGDAIMAINGVPVGGTGTFQIGLVPPNGVPLQSGPTVSADDSNVTLGPVGSDLSFTAAVAAGDTGTSFNITVMGVNGIGTSISHVFNIPILAPPPVQVTDFSLNQTS